MWEPQKKINQTQQILPRHQPPSEVSTPQIRQPSPHELDHRRITHLLVTQQEQLDQIQKFLQERYPGYPGSYSRWPIWVRVVLYIVALIVFYPMGIAIIALDWELRRKFLDTTVKIILAIFIMAVIFFVSVFFFTMVRVWFSTH